MGEHLAVKTSADGSPPEPKGRSVRRRVLALVGMLLVVASLAGLVTILYLRSARFNRTAVSFIEAKLGEYGMRVEIGSFGFTLNPQTARLKNFRIYNAASGELMAQIDQVDLAAAIRDPLGLRRKRELVLERVRLEGLELHLRFDREGRSNFDGLRRPAGKPPAVLVDYSHLLISLAESRVRYHDERVDFGIELDGVALTARAEQEARFGIELEATHGRFGFEGRHTTIGEVRLAGRAAADGMKIERLRLASKLGQVEARGSLPAWAPFRYEVDFTATGDLGEVARLFAPGTELAGLATCQCRIRNEVGTEREFAITGELRAARLGIAGAELTEVRLPGIGFRRTSHHFEFGARAATAQRVVIDEIVLNGPVVDSPRGTIRGVKTRVESGRARLATVEWPGSRLEDLTLAPWQADFAGGRYAVRAAASLASGVISGIEFRETTAAAIFDPEALVLSDLHGRIDAGSVAAAVTIPLSRRRPFEVRGDFTELATRRIFSLFGVERMPIAGTVSGQLDLRWFGGEAATIGGTITADLNGGTTGTVSGIPVTGRIAARATEGVFSFAQFDLQTPGTTAKAGGTLAVDGQSDLRLEVASTRASELVEITRSFPELEPLIASYDPYLPRGLGFDGRLNGDLTRPVLNGRITIDPLGVRGIELGRLAGQLYLSGDEMRLTGTTLTDADGGSGRIELELPFKVGATEGRLDGTLDRFGLTRLLELLDPERRGTGLASQLTARLSGTAHLTGLPGKVNGTVELRLSDGKIVRQSIDSARAAISFVDHRARLEALTVRLPQTTLQAAGEWNLADDAFSLKGQTSNISLSLLAEALEFKGLNVGGAAEISFEVNCGPPSSNGVARLDWERLAFNLVASSTGLEINNRPAGDFRIYAGTNSAGRLRAVLNSRGAVEKELIFATVELKERSLPLTIRGELDEVELSPFIALLAPERAESLRGKVSGGIAVSGPLRNEAGQVTPDGLRGDLTIRRLDLVVEENRLRLAAPLTIELARSEVTLPMARLVGEGLELILNGRVGLTEESRLALGMRGTIDLSQLIGFDPALTIFGKIAIEAQADGTVSRPSFTGAVDIRNLGLSSRELPFFLSNGNGLITLAGNQLELNSFRANANDGRLEAKGFIRLAGIDPDEWRIEFKVEKAEVYVRELSASLNATLALSGTPAGQTISGVVNATRLEYDSSLDLDDLIGGGGVSLDFDLGGLGGQSTAGAPPTGGGGKGPATGAGGMGAVPTRLDLRLEARDSLAIRGEELNAIGTALLTVTGTSRDPNLNGRLESESGYVRFRGQRYEITRATLDLLPGSGGTVLNLIAESDFRGYRVSLGLAGQIDAIETTLRSEPALSRDEIISLITTGRTESGALTSQDPLRSGVGAAASFISSGLISRPTEQLLGLSRFQIDPIIRPNANPAARLTVGQQLSRNLYVSYSTNLATEQDQTALAEYTFTNRFSGLATYTQGGSSTRQGLDENVVTIELRGRQRFSLGFLPELRDRTGPPASPAPPERRVARTATGPLARVEVTPLEELRLSEKRLRELLPVMSQGFSRSLARLGERRLREYLQEQGYFFAEVNFRCEPVDCESDRPGTAPAVFYDIEPNRIYALKEIRLVGTSHLRIEAIRDQLQCETASRVGGIPFFKDLPLIGGSLRGLTSNERLKSDEETIRRQLVELGYLRARVNSRLAVRPENDDLLLIFNVEEGPLSRVGEIVIEGNRAIPTAELRREIALTTGAPYAPGIARAGAQQIRRLYADRGYLDAFANLEIEEEGGEGTSRLRLTYRLSEGRPAIVSEIRIAGTTRTSLPAIRRYYDFQPGEKLTPEKLRATQSALYATNAFREVNLRVEDLGAENGPAHRVTVNLSEAKPLLFVYGLGYSSDDGIRGSIELANTNLRGSLNSLALRLRASSREQVSQLSFADLRPLGLKLPTTISVFYNRSANLRTFVRRRVVDADGQTTESSEGDGFGLDRYGTFIQTQKKIDARTSLRFRYNFERAGLFGIDEAQYSGTEVTRNERAIRLGMLSVGISRDTRDNVLNPTRGQLISADHSLAAVPLGGNESFNKFFGTFQHYQTLEAGTPLLGGTTLAVSARLGLASVFRTADRNKDGVISESEQRLPISERFFSGGATTLRGFRFETAGPQEILEARPGRSCTLPARPCDLPTLVPVGGDALAILNLELRYPLTERLRLVPFYDLGNVFRRVSDFSFSRLSHTVGIGLRINTPIGPVGIDYGLLLDPPTYQSTTGALIRQPRGVFHIRLGQSF
jgi:outer membrane protein assembly complex protein YaeT